MNGNGKLVTALIALCMFLSGVVVAGVGGVIRGDYLGREAAQRAEERLVERQDLLFREIIRRLERLENRMDER